MLSCHLTNTSAMVIVVKAALARCFAAMPFHLTL